MQNVTKSVATFLVCVAAIACDAQKAPDAPSAPPAEQASVPAPKATVGTSGEAPDDRAGWARDLADAPTLTVDVSDATLLFERDAETALEFQPVLVVSVAEDRAERSIRVPLRIGAVTPREPAGFDAEAVGESDIVEAKLSITAEPGSPVVAVTARVVFGGAATVTNIRVELAQLAEFPTVLRRDYTWERLTGAAESHAATPAVARLNESFSFVGGPGTAGWQVTSVDDGAVFAAELFDSVLARPGCAEPMPFEAGASFEASFQLLVGQPAITPSNFPSGGVGAVALAMDDTPDFERTRYFDIGVPTVDSDGALELGVFYSKLIPSLEGLSALGGHAKTAARYGVEYVPAPTSSTGSKALRDKLAERFAVTTMWPRDARPCDAASTSAPRTEVAFSGASTKEGFDLFDSAELPRGAAIGLSNGKEAVARFASRKVASATEIADLLSISNLEALQQSRGLSIVQTSTEHFVNGGERPKMYPESRKSRIVLTRFRNERHLTVAPVGPLVAHYVAMRQLRVEHLAQGRVRVTNPTERDVRGATFVLPEGSEVVSDSAHMVKQRAGAVWFDLPAGASKELQLQGASPGAVRLMLEK